MKIVEITENHSKDQPSNVHKSYTNHTKNTQNRTNLCDENRRNTQNHSNTIKNHIQIIHKAYEEHTQLY